MFGKSLTSKQLKLIYDKIENQKQFDYDIERLKELFSSKFKNREEFSKLVYKFMVPTENEKKKNAEISTPDNLRREMLDTIPKDFWSNKNNRVLEPCSGKGSFVLDVVNRFMTGLQKEIQDEKERYKFIVENLVYFGDINQFNIFIVKLFLDPLDEYRLNFHEGDMLNIELKDLNWEFFKFDLVVGNPPYQTDPSKNNNKPIYNKFIERWIDNCNLLLFVVPSRWFSGGKGLDKFRKFMMLRKDIKFIVHEDNSKKWFKQQEIKGGVNYFLKDTDYQGLCNFNGVKINLDRYDIIPNPKFLNILNKMEKNIKNSINNIYKSSSQFKIRTNDERLKELDKLYKGRYFKIETNDKRLKDEGTVKCYVSSLKTKDRVKYLENYELTEDKKFWKVITARAAHKGGSGFGFIKVLNPEEVYTDSYISFKVCNELEAQSLESYLKCKLPNLMLSIRKISQDISGNTCKWIPLPPLDRIWTNESVNKYFDVTEKDYI